MLKNILKLCIAFSLLIMMVTGCSGKYATPASKAEPALSSSNCSSKTSTSSSVKVSDADGFDKKALALEMMKAANAYKDIYESIDKKQYFNVVASDSQREQIVDRVGALGYPVVSDGINMQNSNAVRIFWQNVKAGKNTELGVYEVENDATLEHLLFKVIRGKTQFICITVAWNSSSQAEIEFGDIEKVDKFELTSKGYFLYHTPAQNGLWDNSRGFRVSALSDKNKALCKKYIEPIGYQGNNIFTESWDEKDITKLNFNDMFEYIYRLEYQKEPTYNDYYYDNLQKINTVSVPAKDFEGVITKYFPVTAAKLRTVAVYNSTRNVYAWQEFCGPQYCPNPEVTAYRENNDGSLTLTVDAVAIEYYSDCDFTDTVTVMPHKDGTFQYLSNSLKIYHSERFPTYSPRIEKARKN